MEDAQEKDAQNTGTPEKGAGRRASDVRDAGIGALMWALTFLDAAIVFARRHRRWALVVGLGFGVFLVRHRAGRPET